MEETKQYDFLATLAKNPNLSLADIVSAGINCDNSSLLSAEEYKAIPAVKEFFKDDKGAFDEKKFGDFYKMAQIQYADLANEEYLTKLTTELTYGEDEWWAPSEAVYRDTAPRIVVDVKPTDIDFSIGGLNETAFTTVDLSIRELAQKEKVVDSETNETLDYTPNDKAGLFSRFTLPTLVLAQYDEDGVHIEDGVEVPHKAGDYKLNENDKFYYETLGNRPIYNKELLKMSDVLTVDGSHWNAIDIFDSDDTKKGAGKLAFSAVAKIAPMFIPGVREAYGLIGAADGIMRTMPVFAKGINSILQGSNDNPFGQFLNEWEGFVAKNDSSVSDFGQQHLFSLETFSTLIGDVSGQLLEQRSLSAIPALIAKKTGKVQDYTKLGNMGRKLSFGYMAATSAQDTYNTFKQAGASDAVAGLGLLSSTFALWKLMQIDYFRDTLFKGTFMDESELRGITRGAAKEVADNIATAASLESPKAAASFVNKFSDFYQNALLKGMEQKGLPGVVARGLSEGTEEVMEEVTTDALKGVTEALNLLGINVTEKDKDLDFGWSARDIASRYGMAAIGGFVGGTIFAGQHAYEKWLDNLGKPAKVETSDMGKLVYYLATGKREDIDNYLRKWHNKGLLGSTNLSIDGSVETLVDNTQQFIPNSTGINQNDAVYQVITKTLDTIEQTIKAEVDPGVVTSKEGLAQLSTMGYSPIDIQEHPELVTASTLVALNDFSSFQNDFYANLTELVQTKLALEDRIKTLSKAAGTQEERKENADSISKDKTVIELQEKLKKARELNQDFLNGKKNQYYSGQGFFAANVPLHNRFLDLSLENYTELTRGRAFDSFNDEQKETIKKEHADYASKEGRKGIYRAYDLYLELSQKYAPILKPHIDKLVNWSSHNPEISQILGQTNVIDATANLTKIKDRLAQLEKVESTAEVEEEKKSLTEEKVTLTTALAVMMANPDLTIVTPQTDKDIEKIFSALNESGEFEILDDVTAKNKSIDNTTTVLDFLLGQYKNEASSGDYRFEDNALNAFLKGLRSSYLKSGGVDSRLKNYIDYSWNAVDDLDEREKFDKTGSSIVWSSISYPEYFDEIRDDLKGLIQNLGVNNASVLSYYESLIKHIGEMSTLLEPENKEELDAFLKNTIPHIKGKSIIEIIKEFDGYRNNINYSAFLDIAKQIGANLGDINLLQLVQQEMNNTTNSSSLESYIIYNDAIKKALSSKHLKRIFSTVYAIIQGAADGTNAVINNFKGGELELLEMPLEAAKLVIAQGKALEDNIKYLTKLSDLNSAKSLRRNKAVAINMRPKWVKSIMDLSDSINTTFGINVKDLWKDFNPKVEESDFTEWEKQCFEFEQALYDKFHEKYPELNSGEAVQELASKLVKLFNKKSLYKSPATSLTDNPEATLGEGDILRYLATVISLPAKSFYVAYNEVFKEGSPFRDPKKDLAPVYEQEFAIRQTFAQFINPGLFNNILDLIQENADYGDLQDRYVKYNKNKTILKNLTNILGSAGCGKTTGVIGTFLNVLKAAGIIPDVQCIAREVEQATKLAESIGNIKPVLTVDQYITEVFGEPVSGYERSEDGHTRATSSLVSQKSVFDNEAKFKILIIDEIETLTEAELFRISADALDNNIFIIGAGDLKQPGTTVDAGGHSRVTGLEDTIYTATPTLTTSMRALAIAKVENANVLGTALDTVIKKSQINPEATLDTFAADTKAELAKIKLSYWKGDFTVVGDMPVSNQEDLVVNLEEIVATGKSVAIITDKVGNYAKYASGNVSVIPYEKRAGGEWDYVIADVDFLKHDFDNAFLLARDIYTLTQRSRLGTVIKLDDKSASLVKFVPDETKSAIISIDSSAIKDFAEWRLASFDGLTSNIDLGNLLENSAFATKSVVSSPVDSDKGDRKKMVSSDSDSDDGKDVKGNDVDRKGNADDQDTKRDDADGKGDMGGQDVGKNRDDKNGETDRSSGSNSALKVEDFYKTEGVCQTAAFLIRVLDNAFPYAEISLHKKLLPYKNDLKKLLARELLESNSLYLPIIQEVISNMYGQTGLDLLKYFQLHPTGMSESYTEQNEIFRKLKEMSPLKHRSSSGHIISPRHPRAIKSGDKLCTTLDMDNLIHSKEFKTWATDPTKDLNDPSTFRSISSVFTNISKNNEESLQRVSELIASQIRTGFFQGLGFLQSMLPLTDSRTFAQKQFIKGNYELYVLPYMKDSGLLISRHYSVDSTEHFDIPILVLSNPGFFGKYTGTIDLVDAFALEKEDKDTPHITMHEFKAANPGTSISEIMGIVTVPFSSSNKYDIHDLYVDNIEALPGVDQMTTCFLIQNNGKVFTLVTDEPAVVKQYFNKSVYHISNEQAVVDRTYNYQLMGVQFPVTVPQFFSLLEKYKKEIGMHDEWETQQNSAEVIPRSILDNWKFIRDGKGKYRKLLPVKRAYSLLADACRASKEVSYDLEQWMNTKKVSTSKSVRWQYKVLELEGLSGNKIQLGFTKDGTLVNGNWNNKENTFIALNTDKLTLKSGELINLGEQLLGEKVVSVTPVRYNYNESNNNLFTVTRTVNWDLVTFLQHMTPETISRLSTILDNYGIYLDDAAELNSKDAQSYWSILENGGREYVTDIKSVKQYSRYAISMLPENIETFNSGEQKNQIKPLQSFLDENHLGIKASSVEEANHLLKGKSNTWIYQYIEATTDGYVLHSTDNSNINDWLKDKFNIILASSISEKLCNWMLQNIGKVNNFTINLNEGGLWYCGINGNMNFKITDKTFKDFVGSHALADGDTIKLLDYMTGRIFKQDINVETVIDLMNKDSEISKIITNFEDSLEC